MAHVVTALRANVRAALQAAVPDVSWPKDNWAKIDPTQLPRGGVATPRVLTERIDVETVERRVDVVAVLKRMGGEDLEDELDADSGAIEVAVLAVFEVSSDDFDLVETQTEFDAGGKKTVGTLMMLFRVVLRTEEGNPNE